MTSPRAPESLLEHPLILKYFGKVENISFPGKLSSAQKDPDWEWMIRCVVADRVLQAMQEPIKVGELVLVIWTVGQVEKLDPMLKSVPEGFHPQYLRLPDQLQPKPEVGNRMHCGHYGYEMKCTECGATEIRTPWMEMTKPPPPSEKCVCLCHFRGFASACPNCRDKHNSPAPEAPEFDDEMIDAIQNTANELWKSPKKTHNQIDELLKKLVRQARAGKGERNG